MVSNTFVEYKMQGGEKVKCTVAFKYLLRLRAENKSVYEKVNNGILNGVKELVDAAYILYGAYLCACYAGENGGAESAMSESDFMDGLGDDLVNVMLKCTEFINKKKN